ncbi:MAG: T9SS type A sorting domain-containing protein, partial [Ignavibacteriales bacterium]|nr:T9SS type A sorting domain-containing protein [Ignavibacteriales bacterium]
ATRTIKFLTGVRYPITFEWDPVELPDGSLHLKDPFREVSSDIHLKTDPDGINALTKTAITSLVMKYSKSINATFEATNGWNLVEPFHQEIQVQAIISIPPGIIRGSFFSHEGGYIPANTILPGHGYWIKSSGDGELIMNAPVKDGDNDLPTSAMYEIGFNVADGAGGTYNLAAGIDPLATAGIDADLGEAKLPPAPPAGIFDARFVFPDSVTGSLKDYRMGTQVYQGTVSHKINYQLSTGSAGFRLNFTIPEINGKVSVNLKDPFGGVLFNQTYNTFNTPISYTVTNKALKSVLVTIIYDLEVPIELISFVAKQNGQAVELRWATARETNNQGFEIEHSRNNITFVKLGYVEGKGTTTEISKYQFTDRNPVSGTSYYRLRQIDFGGSFEYSKTIEFMPTQYSLGQNYPNPFNPTTKIKFVVPVDAKVVVKVYNSIGQEVAELTNSIIPMGLHQINFRGSGLTSGVYFYTIDAKGIDGTTYSDVKKMVLMR